MPRGCPAGSVIVVDDFHAAAAAGRTMTDLVERWQAGTAQLVLAGRVDPPVRLHRLRMSGELCELRNSDLYLSLAESGALLGNFGVRVAPDELALLHGRSEGWVAALQMAALTLRTTKDPAQAARALDVRSHTIAEYFINEVLEQQPPEVAGFMLETSVLDELTADACAAVTAGRTRRRCCAASRRPTCSSWRSMMTGGVTGITIWCARCYARSCVTWIATGSSRCVSG